MAKSKGIDNPAVELQENNTKIRITNKSNKSKNSQRSTTKVKPPEPLKLLGSEGLFRYATKQEKIYMILGFICAILHGGGVPVVFIFYGQMTDKFIDFDQCTEYTKILLQENPENVNCINQTNVPEFTECSPDQIQQSTLDYDCLIAEGFTNETAEYYPPSFFVNSTTGEILPPTELNIASEIAVYSIIFAGIGIAATLAGYLQVLFFTWSAAGQAREIRIKFFRSVVEQEIGWFDLNTVGELNSKIAEDIGKIAGGMGDVFSVLIQKISTFILGFIVAYSVGPALAGIITIVIPAIIIGGFFMGKFVGNMTTKELKAYSKASSVSQEAIDGIRVVTIFEGQDRETERYDQALEAAEKQGIKKGVVQGVFAGYIWLVVFVIFGVSFYVGSVILKYDPGNLLTVFFCILMGSINLTQAAPNLEAVSIARSAARPIYDIIERESKINPKSTKGRKLQTVKGDIEFVNVSFSYPSRPDIKILKNCSFKANANNISAIIGPSGMGKSTLFQLILRYYDPDNGYITLDGVDLRELNVAWLRSLIAIVEQEPMLLGTTVMENIRFGNPEASDAEVYDAAKKANCFDFINELPQGFNTELISGGGGLSGGQKQRVGVARALIRNSKILLLDQATSALDTHSEKLVINEINARRVGHTTILIAHRLSTIRAADIIYGIERGTMVESGTHDELIQNQGVYFTLVTLQGGDKKRSASNASKPRSTVKSRQSIKDYENEIDQETGLTRTQSKRFKNQLRQSNRSLMKTAVPVAPQKESDEPFDPLANEIVPVQENIGRRILKYNSPELLYMSMGALSACINGAVQPSFSIIFSSILAVLAQPESSDRDHGVLLWSLAFVLIGIVNFFTQFLQIFSFGLSGEKLTRRLRRLSFHSIVGQDMTWFDSPKNSPSVLVGSLATDCAMVQGAAGKSLGAIFQAVTAIAVGLSIAFAFGWQLALVVLCFFPLMILAGVITGRIWSQSASQDRLSLAEAGRVVSECLENIRMVTAYGKEDNFDSKYIAEVQKPYNMSFRTAHKNAILYAVSQTIVFFAYSASFGYGGWLVQNDIIQFSYVFRVFSAVFFAGQAVGRAMSFAPDYAKAKIAADSVFNIIDRKATYADPYSDEGKKLKPEEVRGQIDIQNVDFRYPSRPDTQVLHKLCLEIPAGSTVAFVGQSGCGKSTSMQLLGYFESETIFGQVT